MNGIVRSLVLVAAIGLFAVILICVSDDSEALDCVDHKVNFNAEEVLVYYGGLPADPLSEIDVGFAIYIVEKTGYHNVTINGIPYDYDENGHVIIAAERDSGILIEAEAIQYSVNYETTVDIIGTLPDSITNRTISSNMIIESPVFSRIGYNFEGWNTSNDGTGSDFLPGSYDLDADFITNHYGASMNLVLYPKWTPVEYSISLSSELGTVSDAGWPSIDGKMSRGYNIETSLILPVPEPEDRFHLFINWEDSEGNPVSQIQTGTIGDIELRAVWIEKSFPVTAAINGRQVIYDFTISSEMPSAEPEDGFAFKGWYYRDEGGNQVRFESMSQLSENMNIYAVFEPTKDDPMVIAGCVLGLIVFFTVVMGYGFTRE